MLDYKLKASCKINFGYNLTRTCKIYMLMWLDYVHINCGSKSTMSGT